ncbi:MAG: hypothetical protein JSV44_07850, partial [Candidatus Zixiibacteriota bacterium]
PDTMSEQIAAAPYSILKIKMGFDGDEALLPVLKKFPGKVFRVDANGGWALEKAERMISDLARARVQLIEQPTPVEHIKEWPHLKGRAPVNVFVDEGLHTFEDYQRFMDYVDGINIKMAKSGGIIEAVRIARRARRDRCKVMLGCMVESSVAIAPAVYMSSLADYLDLDGPLLLEDDTATGITYIDDNIIIDDTIIGGPKLKDEYAHGMGED